MDDPQCEPIVQPSTGTHIVFPSYYSPRKMGLIDPSSSDGRVVFFLPWEGNTLAGTTDAPAEVTFEPKATGKEISFIVEEVRRYLDPTIQVRNSDVLAAWSGLRPLVRDPARTSTQELVRNHIVIVSASGLMTIAGGKWTTYRKMAQETIDAAITHFNLHPRLLASPTEGIPLIGAHGYHGDNDYIRLVQQFGLETDVAMHLSRNYGDRAPIVAALEGSSRRRWPLYGCRLVPHYPFLEAEVRYAARCEYAVTAVDILARRTRLAFLSCQAAQDALPRVVELMAEELGWSASEQQRQTEAAKQFLATCGLSDLHPVRAEFERRQLEAYKATYERLTGGHSQWPRLSYAQAIEGWKSIIIEQGADEASTIAINWDRLVQSIDGDAVGSIGVREFITGMSLIKAAMHHPNGAALRNGQPPPIPHPVPERNSWSL